MTVVRPNSIAGINSITVQTGQALNIHDANGNLIRNITSSTGISTFQSLEITKGTGDLKVGVSTLFVDQSTGKIGIGTDVPASTLQITKGASGGAAANTDAALIIDNSSHTYVQFRTPANKESGLLFGDAADNDAGAITYNHTTDALGFRINADERLKITSAGNIDIPTGNLGIHTTDANTEHIAGAASSFIGLYLNDGYIGFPTHLNRNGGYFIATHVNALNAGPVSLGSSMTLHGTWTIV